MRCPVCHEPKPPGFLVCEACTLEVPAALHTAWQCASHHAHSALTNKKPADRIAQAQADEDHAARAILSHLRQHGSAL